MITYSSMLQAVASHVLTHPNERVHITRQQAWTVGANDAALDAWAATNKLCLTAVDRSGYPGWFVSAQKK